MHLSDTQDTPWDFPGGGREAERKERRAHTQALSSSERAAEGVAQGRHCARTEFLRDMDLHQLHHMSLYENQLHWQAIIGERVRGDEGGTSRTWQRLCQCFCHSFSLPLLLPPPPSSLSSPSLPFPSAFCRINPLP